MSRLAIPNCYRLIARHGYMDEVISPDLASLIYEQVRAHIVEQDREALLDEEGKLAGGQDEDNVSLPGSMDKRRVSSIPDAEALVKLQTAYEHEVLYIIGKEEMRVKETNNFFRRGLLSIFLFFRENTRSKIANLAVQRDRVLEVGFVKDI